MKILVDEIEINKCPFEMFKGCLFRNNCEFPCFLKQNKPCPYLKEYKPAEDDCK